MKRIILLLSLVCIVSLTSNVKEVFCLPWPPEIDIMKLVLIMILGALLTMP